MQVQFEHIFKEFPGVTALRDIQLTIEDGELFFLLGPSGCGKTTLLRCLGGFEQPTRGRVLLNGQDVTSKPANLRDCAMVFQGYALFPHMTVEENVAFGLEMRGVPAEDRRHRVDEALSVVQIAALRNRRPAELSGGQQQRVALARTLVVKPGVLLLDEPLANLDAKLRRDMRLEIRRICKDAGLTAVYVTHDRQEALSMADRMAVMKDGVIRQVGSPLEIYRRPVDAFVANFIGETNVFEGVIDGISAGGARVRTACGDFLGEAVQKTDFQTGQRVRISIRPEAFRLVADAEHPTREINQLAVNVKQTEYLGELLDCIGETRGETSQTVKFFLLNPTQTCIGEGQRNAVLEVSAQDVVVMPDVD